MKTLKEAIVATGEVLGDIAYGNEMQGSMQPWYGVETYGASVAIAAAYDEDIERINKCISEESRKAYYAKWDRK